jgi:hypothetical protein
LIQQSQFPIREGKTYYVRASAPGFEPVSSSCTVPHLRETNLDFVVTDSINDIHNGEMFNWPHHHGYLEWTDYPGEENYYMFSIRGFQTWYDYDYYNYDGNEPIDSSNYFTWWTLFDDSDNPCIYSDKGYDGKKWSILMMVDFWLETYDITMFQLDRNCYLFEKSTMESDDEFFSAFVIEPTQIYSNVKNGYGLFGAFVMKDYSFEFDLEGDLQWRTATRPRH